MISTAKPVIKYLSTKYNNEKSKSDAIEENIKSTMEDVPETTTVAISQLKKNTIFNAPVKKTIQYTTISYRKPKQLVDKVKSHMGTNVNKKVGTETFDFYVELEGI